MKNIISSILCVCLGVLLPADIIQEKSVTLTGGTVIKTFDYFATESTTELRFRIKESGVSATVNYVSKSSWVEGENSIGTCDSDGNVVYEVKLTGDEDPTDLFVCKIDGDVTSCSGGGGSAATFDFDLDGSLPIDMQIEPPDAVIAVDESLRLVSRLVRDDSLMNSEDWTASPSSGIVMSLSSNGVAIVSSDYPMSTIYFRSSVPGEYEVSATPEGGTSSDAATSNVTVVGVASLDSNVDSCMVSSFEGGMYSLIGFTANPEPDDASFSEIGLQWDATVGSFISDDGYGRVTWKAPKSGGGEATITVKCGTQEVSKTVKYYNFIVNTDDVEISREESEFIPFTASPSGSEVDISFATNDESIIESSIEGGRVVLENLIEKSHAIPLRDLILGNLTYYLPEEINGTAFVVFDFNIKPVKKLSDWLLAEEVQDVDDATEFLIGMGVDSVVDQIKDTLTINGVDTVLSDITSELYRARVSTEMTWLRQEIRNSVIAGSEEVPESSDANWDLTYMVTSGELNFSPGSTLLSLGEFLIDLNDAGAFDGTNSGSADLEIPLGFSIPFNPGNGSGEINALMPIRMNYNGSEISFPIRPFITINYEW